MTLFSFSLLALTVSAAIAHPGKTDYQDGHKCLKNCEDWDMSYEEYHLHDRDRNAIRTEGRRKSLRLPATAKKSDPEPSKQEVAAVPVPLNPEPRGEERRRTAPADQGYSMPVEAGFVMTLYDIMLLGVAGLLFLVMLFLRIKERTNKSL
ncbi:MAG: hypothetical protein HZA15_01630 [Nitrospirae bacterium]|nr:hypothetical protein [Nitrospirota bacterium]